MFGFVVLMIRRTPRSTQSRSSAASDVYKRQVLPDAISRSRIMLEHTGVDWASLGYRGTAMDELVEYLLRMIQSMVIAPSDPPRSSPALRSYLRRWIAPVLSREQSLS